MSNRDVENVDEPEMDAFSLPTNVEELVVPHRPTFAPWHKPRKQYVRKFQWVKHARGVIEKLREAGKWDDGSPLKYLTLPGPDLLDIRLLAELCSDEKIDLLYTGFCHTSETEAERLRKNIHQFSIDHGERTRPGSEVHSARIEDVTIQNSSAETLMRRDGPYDIVNIDACSPIANDNHERNDRLIDAIRKIVEFQLESSRLPWVLYLTTQFQTDSISEQSLNSLHDQILQNAQSNEEFAVELAHQFDKGEDIDGYLNRTKQMNGIEFVKAATLGLSKWFVHLADQANYSVKKLKGFCYSLFTEEPFEPNMISVCYLFLPEEIQISDDSGLTPNTEVQEGAASISDHVRALRGSLSLVNLDEKLSIDGNEKTKMIEETKQLLRQAGYEVDDPDRGYDAWLASIPIEIAHTAAE